MAVCFMLWLWLSRWSKQLPPIQLCHSHSGLFCSLSKNILPGRLFHAAPVAIQVVEATTANGVCTMRIKAVPLPGSVATAIDKSADLIRMTLASSGQNSSAEDQTPGTIAEAGPEGSRAPVEASDTVAEPAQETNGAAEEPAQGGTTSAATDSLAAAQSQNSATGPCEASEGVSSTHQSEPEQNGNNSHEQNPNTAAVTLSNGSSTNGSTPLGLTPDPAIPNPSKFGSDPTPTSSHNSKQQVGTSDADDSAAANVEDQQQHTDDGTAPQHVDVAHMTASASANVDGEQQETDDGDAPQQTSGKIGALKQRLQAAAEEAGSGASGMLQVGQSRSVTHTEIDQ